MIGHYLLFNRNCLEALETYEKAFGAKITEIQKYGDMPPDPAFTVSDSDKDLLKQGGEIYMDLAPAFFAAQHGSLRDKFGINWMFTALK